VSLRKRLGELESDTRCLLEGERPTFNSSLQSLPLIAIHHDEELFVRCFVNIVDGADVGVLKG
jgi:hypothetical protein